MTRLHSPANKGSTSITVAPALDLVAGDRIALAATSFAYDAGEDRIIKTYNAETGVITFDEPLKFYHWGAPLSTSEKYEGVDIRGEVILLSRNIVIQGEDVESYGCQIVTGETVEFDADLTVRSGSTILDSVEIYNCS
jgi:hypothetical protein